MSLKKSGPGWTHHPAKIIRLMDPSACKLAPRELAFAIVQRGLEEGEGTPDVV
jgi:hypothetical protein